MDEKSVPNAIGPQAEADEGLASTGETPEDGIALSGRVPVVGIRASAGGLEVFKLLLASLPANTGLGIVFIQHYSGPQISDHAIS